MVCFQHVVTDQLYLPPKPPPPPPPPPSPLAPTIVSYYCSLFFTRSFKKKLECLDHRPSLVLLSSRTNYSRGYCLSILEDREYNNSCFKFTPNGGSLLYSHLQDTALIYRRPTGSELKVPSMGAADEIKSTNPDHIGGYEVALPIFTGIETKFGLCLPRFQATVAKK